jgi:hypothetical protein
MIKDENKRMHAQGKVLRISKLEKKRVRYNERIK